MLPTRSYKKNPCSVTIGLVDGKLKTGRMAMFMPHAPEQRKICRGRAADP